MKNKLVFSLVHDQSVFMTVVISILTFVAILTFGIALSIGTGIIRWNTQWDNYATIQIIDISKTMNVKNILDTNKSKIESITEISKDSMKKLMNPWISSGADLAGYLPTMFEVKFKNNVNMQEIKSQLQQHAKFLTHTTALKPTISTGWKMLTISSLIMLLILASICICVSCIAKNIAMLHKHELEILNQIGATDKFIIKQMQKIIGKISICATFIGFIGASPILLLILYSAHTSRVGLMAMLTLSIGDWIALIMLPIIIVLLSINITKKTTIKILSE